MRTTLTIDEGVARAIEKLRRRKNLSLREAVGQLLRAGLHAVEKEPDARPYSGLVFDGDLKPGIDPNRMNQLADELEVEDHLS